MELANAESIAGNPWSAFAELVRVVRTHPHYYIAGYRLPVAAMMLSAGIESNPAPTVAPVTILDDLREFDGGEELAKVIEGCWQKTPPHTIVDLRRRLLEFATKQLTIAEKRLRGYRLLWHALSREGRQEQLSYLWFRVKRGDAKQVIESCKYVAEARIANQVAIEVDKLNRKREKLKQDRDELKEINEELNKFDEIVGKINEELEEISEELEKIDEVKETDNRVKKRVEHWRTRDTAWQVHYNVACYWSIRTELQASKDQTTKEAVESLAWACRSRGVHQLVVEWLDKDPDLNAIREDPRFR